MIVRLRSRDGLERVEVDDKGTVMALKLAIQQKLKVPFENMVLSKDAALLTSKTPQQFKDLADDGKALKAAGVQHGEQLFMWYPFERDVEPAVKKSEFEKRRFGEHVNVSMIMAKQTRIERQDKAHIASVSFDHACADAFQSYVQGALAFNIKRGGLLYGSVADGGQVMVEFIYEPPQEGDQWTLTLHRHTPEEQQVDYLAGMLGLKKVGWVFSQSNAERGFIVSTHELKAMAAMQDELGESCASVMVMWDAAEQQVHFEAYQVSDQAVQLARDGWMLDNSADTPAGVTKMRNPKEPSVSQPVIVASKDASEVDNDYFLCPASIAAHTGRLLNTFPVENRLLPQGKAELREHLRRHSSKEYVSRLSDLHLLLWLSKQPNLDPNDMALLCDAVKEGKPVMEGYRVIIDSIAGM